MKTIGEPENTTSIRTVYENRDWRYLHPDLAFKVTGGKRYAIMLRELR